ncbi:MAG: hypothetical protein PVS3B1_32300 [Ktedonobacteraceae bacterium]
MQQILSDVWQFSALQVLFLSYNQLTSIPSEIGSLSALQSLSLNNNQLTSIPSEIASLSALQSLDLNNNQLTSIPSEIGSLSVLQRLSLDNNPLRTPPPEIVAQGTKAILAFLRALPGPLDDYLASQQDALSPQHPVNQARKAITVFYSYDQEDEAYRKELGRHLSGLRSQQLIVDWHAGMIAPGMDRQHTESSYLEQADLILLLVSSHFMASEHLYGEELQRALQRHAEGTARVVPILLRPVDWTGAPFASLSLLPSTGEPISRWPDRDDAFLDVVQGIRRVIQELLSARLQGVQGHIEALHAHIDALKDPYARFERSLESVPGEHDRLKQASLDIEKEMAALQQKQLKLQRDMEDLSKRQ